MAKHINLDLLHHKLKAFQLAMLKITESTTLNDLLVEKLTLSDELGKIIEKYLKPIKKGRDLLAPIHQDLIKSNFFKFHFFDISRYNSIKLQTSFLNTIPSVVNGFLIGFPIQ